MTAGVVAAAVAAGELAAAGVCAVALAVAATYLARALHPPAVGTALVAVTGGPTVHPLGLVVVAAPAFTGAVVMLGVALVANDLTHDEQRNCPVTGVSHRAPADENQVSGVVPPIDGGMSP
ncbi:HPP family protein [Pseudonocardia thermophila]|uniref:HPP family protein n=1 Tax=Pseudonocardia thermophila TaxID=1848 RepID=A0A1M6PJE6_PSETH|nr:HPP family protein [Pseudonocardia thermophila]